MVDCISWPKISVLQCLQCIYLTKNIYPECLKNSNNSKVRQFFQVAKYLNKHFTTENKQMTHKRRKKGPKSLFQHVEMKRMIKLHQGWQNHKKTPYALEWLKFKRPTIPSVGKDVGIASGSAKRCLVVASYQVKQTFTICKGKIHSCGLPKRNGNIWSQRFVLTNVHSSFTHTSPKLEKNLCYLSIYCLSGLNHPSSACFMILEQEPVSIYPLPAGTMLPFVTLRALERLYKR